MSNTIEFSISTAEWEVLKLKIRRKYNTLSEADLSYQEGQEEELVERLAKRLRRKKDYIFYTLSKEKADISSNRL